MNEIDSSKLIKDIRLVIEEARGRVQQVVNSAMVQTYWQIGRLIVEDEQHGNERAAYGKKQLESLFYANKRCLKKYRSQTTVLLFGNALNTFSSAVLRVFLFYLPRKISCQ